MDLRIVTMYIFKSLNLNIFYHFLVAHHTKKIALRFCMLVGYIINYEQDFCLKLLIFFLKKINGVRAARESFSLELVFYRLPKTVQFF
jgi:hypothetical protein